MKGIIFDFNGTLYWDSQLHYDAWREYSKMLRGYEFSDEESINLIMSCIDKLELPDEEYNSLMNQIKEEFIDVQNTDVDIEEISNKLVTDIKNTNV